MLPGRFGIALAAAFALAALLAPAVALAAPDLPRASHDALTLGQETPEPTNTPAPTDTPVPTNTPVPTETPAPTNTPVPTETAEPTDTPDPTDTPEPTPTEEGEGGDGDGDGSTTWLIVGVIVIALIAIGGLAYYLWRRSQETAARADVISTWDEEARDAYASAASLQDQITSQLAAEQSTGAPVDLTDAGRRASDVNAQLRRLEISPPDDARRFAIASVLSTLDALRTSINLNQTGAVTLDAVRQRLNDYSTSLAALRATLAGEQH